MPDDSHRDEHERGNPSGNGAPAERTFIHRILRYVPNLLRDEWVNIGVLLYDPGTGERRLRMIKEDSEFGRIRRLRPPADERILRGMRDHLESRLSAVTASSAKGGNIRGTFGSGSATATPAGTEWLQVLEKWDATLSNCLQLADPRATTADDINAEVDRLYHEFVTVPAASRTAVQFDTPRTRPQMRNYMDQVFRQAGLWGRIQKFIPVGQYTLDDDPLEIDYSYIRNDNKMRGFVQAISLTDDPDDLRTLALVARRIQDTAPQHGFAPEFTAVTNIDFDRENSDHRFFQKLLGSNGVTSIPLDNFAVWVAKLEPMVQ